MRLREPVYARDLRLRVVRPVEAPAWGAVAPQVEVENVGSAVSHGATLALRIEAAGAAVHQSRTSVPDLDPGQVERVQLPQWTPPSSGTYGFAVELEGTDEQPGDNRWQRTFEMHKFVDVAAQMGIAGTGSGWAGAWTDYDADGDQDLYLSGAGAAGQGASRLLRSEGGHSFTDVTAGSGAADLGNGTGAVVADLSGDGLVDIFLAKGGFVRSGEASRLLHNRGDGTFADVSSPSGLEQVEPSYGAAVGDYDGDGDLDLYVPRALGRPNTLYRNDGGGTFADVTLNRGIRSYARNAGSAAIFVDLDNDGDQDLYAGIYGSHDVYYTNVGEQGFGAVELDARTMTSGVTAGDYDNDGDLDLYVANAAGRSTLHENALDSHLLLDVGAESGTEDFGVASGCAFGDVDNDGDLDLYVSNLRGTDRLYVSQGNGRFQDMARAFGVADTAGSRSVLLADYDVDGDLDIYTVGSRGGDHLYHNGGSPNSWLEVRTRARSGGADVPGARVYLFAGGETRMAEVSGASGYSLSSRTVHFGLGERQAVDSVQVRWPGGAVQTYRNPPVNALLAVTQGEEGVTAVAADAAAALPAQSGLWSGYPNPFNASVTVPFDLASATHVELAVHDALGQQVRLLLDEELAAGAHRAIWDGLDDAGRQAATGVYLVRMRVGHRSWQRPVVLAR